MFVVIFILLLILDALTAITLNVSFAIFVRYSRSSKLLLRKNVLKLGSHLPKKIVLFASFKAL